MANIDELTKSVDQKMDKTLETLKADLYKVRTGRAHSGLLDHLQVDYYGNPTPLNQVANVSVIDARTLGVAPWEKQMVKAVEKSIRDSDLGLNPATLGDVVRVPMPALTEERRKDLIKVVRREAEAARVAIRNVRREANHSLKDMLKAKTISEDEEHKVQDDIQKRTDRHVADIDKALVAKEADLLAV